MAKFATLEEYLTSLTDEQRRWLDDLRATIREELPDATEEVSYSIGAFKVGGRAVVWYAAYRDHYSMHPSTPGLEKTLGERIAPHLSGKGTIRFDADKPAPRELVRDIVKLRLAEVAGA